MKTKNEKIIIRPRFKEYFKKVLDFRDHSVFDISHSVERYNERIGKDIFLYEKLLKKGINYLIKNNIELIEDRYIWYSKKYGFGIQVDWREDNNKRYAGYNGWTATTLSEDEMKFFKKADKKIFLENLLLTESKENVEYLMSRGYARYEFKGELKEEMDICNFDLFIEEGEIYHTFELIEL